MTENNAFDLQEFLPYLLNQAAEASSLEFQQLYKDRYGMLRAEWRVLFHLGLYGSMTAGEIGRRARVHKTKISRAVHRLAERRFLTRNRDVGDSIKIKYVDSENLDYQKEGDVEYIHKNYNVWTDYLRQDIAVEIGKLRV